MKSVFFGLFFVRSLLIKIVKVNHVFDYPQFEIHIAIKHEIRLLTHVCIFAFVKTWSLEEKKTNNDQSIIDS